MKKILSLMLVLSMVLGSVGIFADTSFANAPRVTGSWQFDNNNNGRHSVDFRGGERNHTGVAEFFRGDTLLFTVTGGAQSRNNFTNVTDRNIGFDRIEFYSLENPERFVINMDYKTSIPATANVRNEFHGVRDRYKLDYSGNRSLTNVGLLIEDGSVVNIGNLGYSDIYKNATHVVSYITGFQEESMRKEFEINPDYELGDVVFRNGVVEAQVRYSGINLANDNNRNNGFHSATVRGYDENGNLVYSSTMERANTRENIVSHTHTIRDYSRVKQIQVVLNENESESGFWYDPSVSNQSRVTVNTTISNNIENNVVNNEVNNNETGRGYIDYSKFPRPENLEDGRPENNVVIGYNEILLTIDSPYVEVNGKMFYIDPDGRHVTPFILDQRTFVPLRTIADILQSETRFDNSTRQIDIRNNNGSLTMTLGQTAYRLNNQSLEMDTAPLVRESRTSVPVRFVAEGLQSEVTWIGATRQVLITFYIEE